jgi:hypothetical protein
MSACYFKMFVITFISMVQNLLFFADVLVWFFVSVMCS